MYVTKAKQAEKWLHQYLTNNGRTDSVSIKDAGYELGFQSTVLSRALKHLNGSVINQGFPRHTYWEL